MLVNAVKLVTLGDSDPERPIFDRFLKQDIKKISLSCL